MHRAQVHPQVADTVRDAHRATWFSSQGCSNVCRSFVGSKLGDPLGDYVYHLMHAEVMRKIADGFREAGLGVVLPYCS